MVGKPNIVERYVERGFGVWKSAFDVLQNHSRFAHALCTFDNNKAVVPIDYRVKVARKTHICRRQKSSVCPIKIVHSLEVFNGTNIDFLLLKNKFYSDFLLSKVKFDLNFLLLKVKIRIRIECQKSIILKHSYL